MPKFMVSLRDENFQLLVFEARERGISLQELIRAVIIPDWVRFNSLSVPQAREPIQLRSPTIMAKEKEVSVLNRIKD